MPRQSKQMYKNYTRTPFMGNPDYGRMVVRNVPTNNQITQIASQAAQAAVASLVPYGRQAYGAYQIGRSLYNSYKRSQTQTQTKTKRPRLNTSAIMNKYNDTTGNQGHTKLYGGKNIPGPPMPAYIAALPSNKYQFFQSARYECLQAQQTVNEMTGVWTKTHLDAYCPYQSDRQKKIWIDRAVTRFVVVNTSSIPVTMWLTVAVCIQNSQNSPLYLASSELTVKYNGTAGILSIPYINPLEAQDMQKYFACSTVVKKTLSPGENYEYYYNRKISQFYTPARIYNQESPDWVAGITHQPFLRFMGSIVTGAHGTDDRVTLGSCTLAVITHTTLTWRIPVGLDANKDFSNFTDPLPSGITQKYMNEDTGQLQDAEEN